MCRGNGNICILVISQGRCSSCNDTGEQSSQFPIPTYRSASPETLFLNHDFPYMVAGDFNIHNPAVEPFRVLSSNEK